VDGWWVQRWEERSGKEGREEALPREARSQRVRKPQERRVKVCQGRKRGGGREEVVYME